MTCKCIELILKSHTNYWEFSNELHIQSDCATGKIGMNFDFRNFCLRFGWDKFDTCLVNIFKSFRDTVLKFSAQINGT